MTSVNGMASNCWKTSVIELSLTAIILCSYNMSFSDLRPLGAGGAGVLQQPQKKNAHPPGLFDEEKKKRLKIVPKRQ